jgi:DNA gyrase subunit B
MPELLDRGYIYIAQPPLYKLTVRKKSLYIKDDEELQQHLLRSALEEAVITPISGNTLNNTELVSLAKEYLSIRVAIGRLSRRFEPSVLWALGELPPLTGGARSELPIVNTFVDSLSNIFTKISRPVKTTCSVQVQGNDGEGDWAIVVETERHGQYRQTRLNRKFFDSSEYQAISSLGEKLRQRVGQNPIVERGERYTTTTNFAASLEWLIAEARRAVTIQRYKGLGEMNADQLWESTMDASNRRLSRVTIEDAVSADEIFSVLMGDEVEPRRQFIESNAFSVTNLDI